ncbi:male-specific lethal 3 homolog isoform X2 [Planococcus citri]|uniref:male-specific lethal 3 homolog isoform X2 n=1 Tax=Planococcus citri TaxID=170843 RepID=UPI0031F72DB9
MQVFQLKYAIQEPGWNSTWDRYVTEDYILKDTPENRKLQQELANEAQLTPGGNLYKRDMRNRRRSSSSRRRSRNCENISSNTQRSYNDEEGMSQGETTQDEYSSDKSSDDEGMSISLKDIPPPLQIKFPAIMKKTLGYDEYLVTKKKKLHKLPANPNIITVLESFVVHYVTHGLRQYISKQARKLKYEDLVARVSLAKEMVDGLRIIFDFTVDNLLMYGEERGQFSEIRHITLEPPVRSLNCALESKIKEAESTLPREVRVLDVLPAPVENKVGPNIVKRVLRSQHHHPAPETNEPHPTVAEAKPDPNVAPKSREEIQNSIASSSCSSNGVTPPYSLRFDGSIIYSRHIKKLVQKEITGWNLIPDSLYKQKPLKPSLVYGATHIARLFVKLPEILQHSSHRPEVQETIIEYSELLLSFLAEHPEWFGESHYVEDGKYD